MNAFSDSELLNTVVRMVVPMRREFGRQLDVQQFLRDSGYAHSMLEVALASKDERLRAYAVYVQQRLASPRIAAGPEVRTPAGPAAPATPGSAAAAAAPSATADDAQALRQRVLDKYRTGLR